MRVRSTETAAVIKSGEYRRRGFAESGGSSFSVFGRSTGWRGKENRKDAWLEESLSVTGEVEKNDVSRT